ncbi:MAG: alpha/beta fold hydrolase [bacterium]
MVDGAEGAGEAVADGAREDQAVAGGAGAGEAVEPINPDAWKELYPFRSHSLRLGDYQYHYLDEGSGEPVVMLHGNPTWSFYYRHLVTGLSDGYRIIVPDHMGCGLSDKPQSYPYTLKQHIDNLEALMEVLNLNNITLALHDWGGAIGMGYAVRHPERIRRLIIFNTAAFLSSRMPWQIGLCRIPVFGHVGIRCFNAFAGTAIYLACQHHERMTPKVRAGYLAPYRSYKNRIAHLRFVQDIPMRPGDQSYPLVEAIQQRLCEFRDRPMLILWGGRDFCFNHSFLETWQRFFPRAYVHVFEDAGHYVVEDAHERILPLVRKFLGDNPLPGHQNHSPEQQGMKQRDMKRREMKQQDTTI